MGGQSVPAATSTDQRIVTGWMADPGLRKRALGIIDPALSGIHDQQQMLLGFQKSDPNQTRKLFGLSPEAPLSEISKAIAMKSRGPDIQMPQVPAAQQGPQVRTAASGGIMSLDDDEPKDPRKFAKGGDSAPKDINKQQAAWLERANARAAANQKLSPADERKRQQYNNQRTNYTTYQQDKSGISEAARQAGLTPADAYLGQAGFFGGALTTDPATGKQVFSVTNPYYNQAVNVLQGMNQQPQQFQQATQAYQDALGGLKGAAGYTPQQVEAQQIEAAKIARGDIRDVNAQMAEVERMQGGPNVRAVKSQAAQMAGPSSWTEQGTAAQYMSPYMQNVVDIQKREANRDFAKQMARLDAQAAQAGAYGGSRSAIERSEARRAQAQRLGDIEAQGLQQAYSQGMGQFATEQGQGLQAGQANLSAAMQSILANQQAGMTAQQLNQMYGRGGFGAQQANMAAQNQAYNNYVQQMLTAQGMNQGMDWNTASQNATMQMQAATANQQAALQAAMANQSAGLQANQQAIGAYGQMAGIGQGLGSLGTQVGNYGSNLANLWGQAGSTLQGLGQNYFNQIQQNAGGIYGGPTTLAGQGTNLLSGAGGQSGSVNRQNTPGSAFG